MRKKGLIKQKSISDRMDGVQNILDRAGEINTSLELQSQIDQGNFEDNYKIRCNMA